MSLRVTIKGKEIEEKSGKNARGEWKIREQTGWMDLDGERRKVKISLRDNTAPYEPGTYDIDEKSFHIDQYGVLGLGRLVLVAVAASARVAGG